MMDVTELKAKLAAMDDEIAKLRVAAENARLDLEVAGQKRRGFARINCPHPQDQRYERSCMGREIDIHCGVCDIQL